MSDDFLTRVLKAFEFDGTDGLWWRFDNGEIRLFATCSDLFDWGSADLEEILPADLELLEQAVKDAVTADSNNMWAGELFCARKRGMRPQGASYKNLPQSMWPLFDAAGPEREVNLLNPHKHPTAVGGESGVQ